MFYVGQKWIKPDGSIVEVTEFAVGHVAFKSPEGTGAMSRRRFKAAIEVGEFELLEERED